MEGTNSVLLVIARDPEAVDSFLNKEIGVMHSC